MADRPRTSRIEIVDNVLPANALCALNVTMRDLVEATTNTLACIERLARHDLLRNTRDCEEYHTPMCFQMRGGVNFVDGYTWACRTCRRQTNLRVDSFFQGTHICLRQLDDVVYWWSINSWSTIVD